MTIAEAVELIHDAYPTLTFKIGVDVWHHHYPEIDGTSRDVVMWDIWDADSKCHTHAQTLDAVVRAFLVNIQMPHGSVAETDAATAEVR